MKKIALTLVAASALGLVACGETASTTNTSNVSEATNEAIGDLENAAEAVEESASNVSDAAANLADSAGEAVENVADAAANETK